MFKLLINNNSLKCVEIANELTNFGIMPLIRPDFSGKITPEFRAVILDKSDKDYTTKTTVEPIENARTFVLVDGDISQLSEENGVLYMPVALPTQSIVSLVKQGIDERCIERNIRTLLQTTYELQENGYFKQFFGFYMSTPSVTQFVTTVAEKIKNELL